MFTQMCLSKRKILIRWSKLLALRVSHPPPQGTLGLIQQDPEQPSLAMIPRLNIMNCPSLLLLAFAFLSGQLALSIHQHGVLIWYHILRSPTDTSLFPHSNTGLQTSSGESEICLLQNRSMLWVQNYFSCPPWFCPLLDKKMPDILPWHPTEHWF